MTSIEPFDLYSSTTKIVAYATVYGIVSIVAFIGKINDDQEYDRNTLRQL